MNKETADFIQKQIEREGSLSICYSAYADGILLPAHAEQDCWPLEALETDFTKVLRRLQAYSYALRRHLERILQDKTENASQFNAEQLHKIIMEVSGIYQRASLVSYLLKTHPLDDVMLFRLVSFLKKLSNRCVDLEFLELLTGYEWTVEEELGEVSLFNLSGKYEVRKYENTELVFSRPYNLTQALFFCIKETNSLLHEITEVAEERLVKLVSLAPEHLLRELSVTQTRLASAERHAKGLENSFRKDRNQLKRRKV